MRIHGVELHSNEEVLETARTHSRFVSSHLTLALIIVSTAFYFMMPLLRLPWVGGPFFALCLLAAALHAWRQWVMYRGTMLIITNQRVIDIDRRGFFDKIVSEVPYESLSDVSYRSRGIFETLTGAGTITFQMIGGKENLAFANLADPAAIHKKVVELRIAHAHGRPMVSDPVEDVMNTVGTLSPTEQRALLASMKRVAPKERLMDEIPEYMPPSGSPPRKVKGKRTPHA